MWDLTTAFDRAPKDLYSTDSSTGQTGVTQVTWTQLLGNKVTGLLGNRIAS